MKIWAVLDRFFKTVSADNSMEQFLREGILVMKSQKCISPNTLPDNLQNPPDWVVVPGIFLFENCSANF
jgi:hypothetical protein